MFAVPAEHRDTFTVIVNSLAVTAQVLYVGLYLFYAKDDKFDFAWRLALTALVITAGILVVEGPMVLLHKWSVKVIGVTASTVSTGIIVSGVFDIVSDSFLHTIPSFVPDACADTNPSSSFMFV